MRDKEGLRGMLYYVFGSPLPQRGQGEQAVKGSEGGVRGQGYVFGSTPPLWGQGEQWGEGQGRDKGSEGGVKR